MNKELKNILVVEDEFIIAAAILRTILSIPGYSGAKVSNGSDAIAYIENHQTNAILMDIGLPGPWNGVQTAQKIREKHTMPILFMSGYTDEDTRTQIQAIENSLFLAKPLTQKEIRKSILKYL